jgi:hypothetical protein
VAVGQALHHHRTGSDATVQFLQRILARRMDGNCGKKLRMLSRQPQHVVVGDVERTEAFHLPAILVIHLVLRQNDRRAEGRRADQIQQALDVEEVEVAVHGR